MFTPRSVLILASRTSRKGAKGLGHFAGFNWLAMRQ